MFNKFFTQITENLNNKYIHLPKALQLLENTNINEIMEWNQSLLQKYEW